MILSGKISSLINQNHFVSVNDLRTFASQEQIRVAFLEYGRNNYHHVVCSLLAQKKQNQSTIAGTFLLSDIIDMQKTNNFQIQNILPLGAFDQNYKLEEFLNKIYFEPIEKKGDILRRKIRGRVIQKQTCKIMIKKQSKTDNNESKGENKGSKGQEKNLSVKNIGNKSLNKQNKNWRQGEEKNKNQRLKLTKEVQTQKQLVKNEVNLLGFMNKKITASQQQSEDEGKVLQKFKINTTNFQIKIQKQHQDVLEMETDTPKTIKQESKDDIQKKLSDLQLDDQQEYQLILRKQKMKNDNKIQKIEKKTADRLPVKGGTDSKPKPRIVEAQRTIATNIGGQVTLFKYMNKK